MKKYSQQTRSRMNAVLFIAMAMVALFAVSCEENPSTPSLYDPNYTGGPTPTLASVTPADSAQTGVDTLTLTGQNYSTVLTDNIVYLNSSVANVVSATTTQLRILTPLIFGDSISTVVAVQRAPKFSNPIVYKLRAAIVKFGGQVATEAMFGITTDTAGNVYVSYTDVAQEKGILKFTPSGVRSAYAPATIGAPQWNSLKMGPSNVLYATRGIRALYAFPANGGGSATVFVAFASGVTIADFDFDADKNIWAGGDNSNIYRVQPNKTITAYPFVGTVRSLRVYSGYLYFSAKTTTAGEQIWRAPISGGVLGTPQVYFDFGAYYPGAKAFGITFASDGTLYIGTDHPGRIVVVQPSLSRGMPYAVYTALVSPACNTFAWGSGNSLYATSSGGGFVQIIVWRSQGAPYYGVL